MVRMCCVPNCYSYRDRSKKYKENGDRHISFHEFPSDITIRYKWIRAISRKDFDITDSSNVCSKHFKDDDFIPFRKIRTLKKNSVPSVFSNYPEYILSSSSHERDISLFETCNEKERVEPCSNNEDTSMSDSKKERNPSVFLNYVKYMTSSSETKQDISHFKTCHENIRLETYPDCEDTMSASSDIDFYPSALPDHPKFIMPSSTPNQNILLSESCNEKVLSNPFSDNVDTSMISSTIKKDLKTKSLLSKTRKMTLEIQRLRKQVWRKNKKIQKLSEVDVEMKKELESFTKDVHHQNLKKLLALDRENLSTPKVKLILTQLKYIFRENFCWPENVLQECALLKSVSPQGYKMIVERDFITLPCKSTLKRYSGLVNNSIGVSASTNSWSEVEIATLKPDEIS